MRSRNTAGAVSPLKPCKSQVRISGPLAAGAQRLHRLRLQRSTPCLPSAADRSRSRSSSRVTTGASALVAPLVRAGAATNTVAIGAGLHGPRGLVATVYARSLKKISALAVDAQGRIWAATAQATDTNTDAIYLVSAAGTTPQKVVTDVHTPLGLLWIGDTLYVAQSIRRARAARVRRHPVHEPHLGADRAERHRRGEWHRAGRRRPPLPRHLGAVRRLQPDRDVVGVGPLVPPRRQRRAGGGRPHPRRGRTRVLARDRRPLRDHEPTRRPRRQDPRATGWRW